jgi:hypothetical protein
MKNILNAAVCEKCGGKMEIRREGSTQGLFCTQCDWSVVTTHISEVKLDNTQYEVVACDGDPDDARHVKAVAQISGTNFLASRKLLQQELPLVFKGVAVDVLQVRETLTGVGISCKVTPEFRW